MSRPTQYALSKKKRSHRLLTPVRAEQINCIKNVTFFFPYGVLNPLSWAVFIAHDIILAKKIEL
jgi:hypothetical protein